MCWPLSKPLSRNQDASPNSDDLRIAVYRLFLDVWAASPINAHTDRSGALAESGRRNLDAISLKPRIAFLLQALEGFDLDQIGQTLKVSEVEAGA